MVDVNFPDPADFPLAVLPAKPNDRFLVAIFSDTPSLASRQASPQYIGKASGGQWQHQVTAADEDLIDCYAGVLVDLDTSGGPRTITVNHSMAGLDGYKIRIKRNGANTATLAYAGTVESPTITAPSVVREWVYRESDDTFVLASEIDTDTDTDTGENNTGGNLGGGIANFDSKSGVTLRFNTFAGAEGVAAALASNLITFRLALQALTQDGGIDPAADLFVYRDVSGGVHRTASLNQILAAAPTVAPTWRRVSATGAALATDNGVRLVTNSGNTLTMPTAPANGTTINVRNSSGGQWVLAAGGGDSIEETTIENGEVKTFVYDATDNDWFIGG